jgi:hypothetical protein
MPWSGGSFTRTNGVNTGATLWVQDRDAGTKILATRHDTNDQDMADGINSTLEKSGSNAATGNLDIGSNRITLVADGTAKTDVATVNQIVSNAPAFQATDTGTANAYVIALSPAITAYAAGQEITFKAGAASTTASTLNVNTLGTKAIKKQNDQDITSGDIESGSIVTVVYDGTSFQMTSQLAGVPSGALPLAGGVMSGALDMNAQELILDLDGDTSITADTDDQIDIRIAGADDFRITANTLTALSGSTIATNTIAETTGASGVTIDGLLIKDSTAAFADGAVATPSITNTGDLNTGVYFPAADTVGVVAGGTEQFRFGSNPIPGGIKNFLLNGAMNVAQRGDQTAQGGSAVYAAMDQWKRYDSRWDKELSAQWCDECGAAGGSNSPRRFCCVCRHGSVEVVRACVFARTMDYLTRNRRRRRR